MQPDAARALAIWREAFTRQHQSAATALRTAFPLLVDVPPPTGCCPTRLRWERAGVGSGTVCVDDHTRATIEFTGLPHVAGVVLDRLLPGLFEDAPRGIAQSGPGEYYWYDEATTAEWTATVDRDGRTDWEFAYISVPDAVMVLDSLHIALPTAP